MQITHCPECKTAFKVSPQQLEVANGWVRCGRCMHVFEAHLHFEEVSDASSTFARQGDDVLEQGTKSALDKPVSQTKRSSKYERKTKPRWRVSFALIWPLSACLLVIVLCWQILVSQRHWLAAQTPTLRPLLTALCLCEVDWPREPDLILIESSSFLENPAGGYIVELHLKSVQRYPLAMPSLELSLTDAQDKVLVRRVFTAKELSDIDRLLPMRDAQFTLNFDLDETVSKHVIGFRALVFYP